MLERWMARVTRGRGAMPVVALFLLGGVAGALAAQQFVVSQKGRMFNPGELTIERGQEIHIINDDGDLLHHAYIESDKMTFDSKDQKPGSTTPIMFPVAGDFEVRCAIHPKMKLIVHVR